MIYSKDRTQTEKNRIENSLVDELHFISLLEQLGTSGAKHRAAKRHIKAALRGDLYADDIVNSWMVCGSI